MNAEEELCLSAPEDSKVRLSFSEERPAVARIKRRACAIIRNKYWELQNTSCLRETWRSW